MDIETRITRQHPSRKKKTWKGQVVRWMFCALAVLGRVLWIIRKIGEWFEH